VLSAGIKFGGAG